MIARRGSGVLRTLLAVIAATAMLLPASPVRAASISFANPDATSKFNSGIDFTIEMTASEAPARLEAQILFPRSIGPSLGAVATPPRAGSSTLHYTLVTAGADHVIPSTPVTITWVAYPADGGAPVTSQPFTYRYEDDSQDWQTYKDGLITVHWVDGPQSFAKQAAVWGNEALQRVGKVLGVAETEPVDMYLYQSSSAFRAAIGSGARQNVGGSDYPEIRSFISMLSADVMSDPYAKVNITHELTHQVVDDATVNPYVFVPRWINEGFAVYESEGNTPSYVSQVRGAIRSGDLLPLTALGWYFPVAPDLTLLAYAESVSAIDYIAKQYGIDAVVQLIVAFKDGATVDEAMGKATGKDLEAIQAEWFASIGAPVPSPFGPQPAPPGPLPSDWQGAAATQAPAASASAAPAPSSGSTAAAATPAATPAPSGDTTPAASSGSDLTLVLIAVVLVAAIVLGGIVIAGRRSST